MDLFGSNPAAATRYMEAYTFARYAQLDTNYSGEQPSYI